MDGIEVYMHGPALLSRPQGRDPEFQNFEEAYYHWTSTKQHGRSTSLSSQEGTQEASS